MRLHGRGVDEHLGWRTACPRKRLEEVHPHALGGPADVPVVEGLVGSVEARRINPARARLEHMNDAADHSAIIDPRLASRDGGQVWLDPRKLLLCQPETI